MPMNDITPEKLIAFCRNIEILEDRKASITADMKEAFDGFAGEFKVKPKALKAAYKNYKEYQKDAAGFVETDTEADALTRKLIPQYQD